MMTTKNIRERNSERRSRLGQYFLNLSLAAFVGLVIGNISSLTGDDAQTINWYNIIIGGVLTCFFAVIGNKIS